MKHIIMPEETWNKWENALRSGEYEKGTELLETPDGNFCCLGVLQMVIDGKVELDENDNDMSACVPSLKWLDDNDIIFKSCNGNIDEMPFIESEEEHITGLNDMTVDCCNPIAQQKYTFDEIADFLKEEVEFTK